MHVLETDIFDSPIIDEVSLFPKPLTKIDRINKQNKDYSQYKSISNSEYSTPRNATVLSNLRGSVLIPESPQLVMSPKRVFVKESGKKDKVFVMDSDRASPMLRAIQS